VDPCFVERLIGELKAVGAQLDDDLFFICRSDGRSLAARPRLRGIQRVAAMRIELRVDRNGQTIFRAECDTERGSSFAEFSKLALREFTQRHPGVSLLDDDVWLKFDSVRSPEAPKTGSP
jgi:hypothetical protein